MKKFKIILLIICAFACVFVQNGIFKSTVLASEENLYIGGIAAGFAIKPQGAVIIGLSDAISEEGVFSPAKNADIKVGDIILKINEITIDGVSSIARALKNNNETPVEVVIDRNGEEIKKFITPKKDKTGYYKLGILVRDDLNGIGTITYFKEDGSFGALGHPVLNEKGDIIRLSGGSVYLCSVIDLIRGEKGRAGELKGIFIDEVKIGSLTKNDESGLFGVADKNYDYKSLTKTTSGEARIGNATIVTCTDGTVAKEYTISVVKIEMNNPDNKNLVIKVTDEDLLSKTGGILQGMSGSPIIQDGKIVGAVTHVFINDPTRGFGISVDKMLEN